MITYLSPESMSKRLRNRISGKIPKVDAVRDLLYLYRRIQKSERSRITRKSVRRMLRDDLLTEKVKQILYQKGG